MTTTRLLLCAAVLNAACALPALALTSGWANVDGSGNLIAGKLAVGVTRINAGEYVVDFTHTLKKCAMTATIGDPGTSATSPPGYITVAGANKEATAVYVAVFNKNGDATDTAFHLNVRC